MSDQLPNKNENNEIVNHSIFKDFPLSNVLENIDQFFRQPFLKPSFPVAVQETNDKYIITAELPGVKKEQISINILQNSVTISYKNTEIVTTEDNKKKVYQKQSSYENYSRTIPLYKPINTRKGKASYRDGLLTISIPKLAGKNIQIED